MLTGADRRELGSRHVPLDRSSIGAGVTEHQRTVVTDNISACNVFHPFL